jgi:hypothetical protein
MPPDFLCIGEQRCGTSWLTQNLKHHPQIWLPPIKAVRYFNDPSPLPNSLLMWQPSIQAERRRFKRYAQRWLAGEWSAWYVAYYLRRPTLSCQRLHSQLNSPYTAAWLEALDSGGCSSA